MAPPAGRSSGDSPEPETLYGHFMSILDRSRRLVQLQTASSNQIRQADAEIISISSDDEGSEPAPAPTTASFGSAQQRDIEVISISSDEEDTEPASAEDAESDNLAAQIAAQLENLRPSENLTAQPASHLDNQQPTWDLTNIGERITQHIDRYWPIDSPRPIGLGLDIPEPAELLPAFRHELPVRYTPSRNATGSGTRWTRTQPTPSTPEPGISGLASPAFEPFEYIDHDAISDSVVLEGSCQCQSRDRM